MTALVAAAVALGYGFASAFVPLVNAEAFAVLAGAHDSHVTAAVAVTCLAAGQSAGKLVLFESARRASGPVARRLARRHASGRAAVRAARWAARVQRWLSRRATALPVVFASATVGFPPIAAVSLAAGAAGGLRRWEFGAVCLTGRLLRFGALALLALA